MATILNFPRQRAGGVAGHRAGRAGTCEIVIFPGIRIERQDVDLSYRLRDTVGRGDFKDIGGKGRSRKSS
ncbi:MAG: hypothetical protein KDJ86_05260 [Bauldia sp.]|uniref:hypothetical protein n=1 Tax=Bauldia sp. TaxID=2575872 RepID=UPI001D2C9B29|nr:hypothetical protein [Bauldia sp.]MCB1495174.1 hypothetical protein [Bauldia sp.]